MMNIEKSNWRWFYDPQQVKLSPVAAGSGKFDGSFMAVAKGEALG
jgi:hypothetical protein